MDHNTRIAVLFVLINFCVAYVSDNVLNDLSKYSKIKALTSLALYFKNKSIVLAGIYAGLTVVFATVILIVLNKQIFNSYIPNTNSHIFSSSKIIVYSIFFTMAYIIGYALDIFIYKMNVFDHLKPFYDEVGAGNGGALSFLFSLVVSLGVLKFVTYLII
jgi:hypothetical protein